MDTTKAILMDPILGDKISAPGCTSKATHIVPARVWSPVTPGAVCFNSTLVYNVGIIYFGGCQLGGFIKKKVELEINIEALHENNWCKVTPEIPHGRDKAVIYTDKCTTDYCAEFPRTLFFPRAPGYFKI